MSERLGDAGTEEVLKDYRGIVSQHLTAHGGSELKSMRDGYMLAFSDATGALKCAIAVQRAFVDYNYAHPEEPVRVRMGSSTGEAADGDDDFLSSNLLVAARIADQAHGSQILISAQLKELTEDVAGFTFDDGREVDLKGLPENQMVYELAWRRDGDGTGESVRIFG